MNIKIHCINAGKSQKQVAEEANTTTATLNSWERETPKSIKTAKRVSKALGITLEELIGSS